MMDAHPRCRVAAAQKIMNTIDLGNDEFNGQAATTRSSLLLVVFIRGMWVGTRNGER
jgi:hypothetical protein